MQVAFIGIIIIKIRILKSIKVFQFHFHLKKRRKIKKEESTKIH